MPFASNDRIDPETEIVHQFNFRMPRSMIEQIHARARAENRSASSVVRQAIQRYLEVPPEITSQGGDR